MRFMHLISTVAFCLAISGRPSAWAADIVYDNSADAADVDYESTDEYGDEVILAASTPRAITEIQLEIYAQFTDNGTQFARVRVYKNDGPPWNGHAGFPTPGASPLFEQS